MYIPLSLEDVSKFCNTCYLSHLDLTHRPGQNDRRFVDDIFRCIFVNEKIRILIKISLKFVSEGNI